MSRPKRRRVLDRVEDSLLGERSGDPAAQRTEAVEHRDGSTPTALERSLGPGCLISLVIVALLLIAFRRLLQIPPPYLAILALAVFVVVMIVLIRMRPIRFDRDID